MSDYNAVNPCKPNNEPSPIIKGLYYGYVSIWVGLQRPQMVGPLMHSSLITHHSPSVSSHRLFDSMPRQCLKFPTKDLISGVIKVTSTQPIIWNPKEITRTCWIGTKLTNSQVDLCRGTPCIRWWIRLWFPLKPSRKRFASWDLHVARCCQQTLKSVQSSPLVTLMSRH